MVVLVASICTVSGKVLLSRQFVEIPRTRVEGLIAAFPKLIGAGSQHTVIEKENIRYVYQSLGNLFLVLLANKQSNILQDIETLRLLGQVVSKVCHSTEEERILEAGFELLSAFDEIVSLGYRDTVTLNQLSSIIEMESHEERIQEIIAQNKEKEAKEMMKEKIKMMDEQRKREALKGRQGANLFEASPSYFKPSTPTFVSEIQASASSKPKASGGGMKLGAASKSSYISAAPSDIKYEQVDEPEGFSNSEGEKENIHFQLEEKVTIRAERDGSLSNYELRGDLLVLVSDSQQLHFKTQIGAPVIDGIQFMTNPKMDKALFNKERVLSLKDPNMGFPHDQNVGVLKWKLSTKEPPSLPFSVICWVSPSEGGLCDVDIEVSLESSDFMLEALALLIPIPNGVEPEVGDCSGFYEIQDGALLWELSTLNNESREAAIHFQCHTDNQGDSFFPISVSFSSSMLLSGLQVLEVLDSNSDANLHFSQITSSFAEEYVIS